MIPCFVGYDKELGVANFRDKASQDSGLSNRREGALHDCETLSSSEGKSVTHGAD